MIFNGGSGLAMAFSAPIGLSYDRWGARTIGTFGAVICFLGMALLWASVAGASAGYDAATQWVFAVGVLICDFGALLNSFGFMGLIWHFPGQQALILALINATYQVSSFLPLGFQLAMGRLGVTLGTVLGAYAGLVLMVAYLCWLMVPPQEEYYAQAKRVLGMPLPKPPKSLELRKMTWRAWEVLRMYTCDHTWSGLAIAIAFSFPSFYMSFAAAYGQVLFGHKTDGEQLAELYVSLNGLVGLVLAPLSGTLADLFGVRALMTCLGLSMIVATATCPFASWPMQTAACLSLILFTTLFTLFISRYLLMYAPPNRFGTVQGLYTLLVILVNLPVSLMGLIATSLLPQGVDAYRVPMLCYGVAGSVSMVLYSVYYHYHPAPATPPLLPEDERELAGNFGCMTLDEVLQVVDIESKDALLKALASTEPEAVQRLIASIDAEKMAEMMGRRDVEDLAKMMEDAPEPEDDDEEEPAAAAKAEAEAKPAAAAAAEAGAAAEAERLMAAEAGDEEQADARIRGLSDKLLAMIKAKDRQGIRDYLLKESMDDIRAVQAYQESTMSEAEQKQLDKDFNACLPGSEFAKLLRQRAELRTWVQELIKRDMQRRVAAMRRKRGAAKGST